MRAPSLLASVLATAALMMAKPAEASIPYAQIISDTLAMPCVPRCTICHLHDQGGKGTVVKPFGKKAMALGLIGMQEGGTEALLVTTLDAMRMTDSDADGTFDVDELTAGLDPSVAGGDLCNGPKYGCGASVATVPAKRGSDPAAALAALVTALAGVLMMRRRHR
jgi:hypothetical protein